LELFFRTGSKKGIQPIHADKLRIQLAALDNAVGPEDMNNPAWRLTFRFVGADVELVDYQDYH
jgi:proteic killer suppression protein